MFTKTNTMQDAEYERFETKIVKEAMKRKLNMRKLVDDLNNRLITSDNDLNDPKYATKENVNIAYGYNDHNCKKTL